MISGGSIATWIWDAEFRDSLGATVLADGKPHPAYTVFRRNDGLRAVVVTNLGDTDSIVCEVNIENARSSNLKCASPEDSGLKAWPGKKELAPGFAAVVFES